MSAIMDWMQIAKPIIPAIVTGIGGIWAHWAWVRKKTKEAELREQERQAKYNEYDKKRKLTGADDDEKINRAQKIMEIAVAQQQNDVDLVKYKQLEKHILDSQPERTEAELIDPPTERGPSGGEILYLMSGDKIECVIKDGETSQKLLRRNDKAILGKIGELYQKLRSNSAEQSEWLQQTISRIESQPDANGYDESRMGAMLDIMAEMRLKKAIHEQTQMLFEGKADALRWVLGVDWQETPTVYAPGSE
jgi:hypothetical protein